MENVTLKYVDVNKMQCSDKEIKVTKRSLETIIEMAVDYSKILLNRADDQERAFDKLHYKYKAEEVQKIANDLSEKINYCKECKQARKTADVGMDAFQIIAGRKKK